MAAEYATWACNLYNGCAHSCSYCYCKRGVMSHAMGGAMPTLKKTAGSTEDDVFAMFKKELTRWKSLIIADGGLFFSFSTDPMLECEIKLTMRCIEFALENRVPVSILTKAVAWTKNEDIQTLFVSNRHLLRIGFTLTGHDELEPGAPSNSERIRAIRFLYESLNLSTFASIEPVIDFKSSLACILDIAPYIDDIRIGLLSPYSPRRYDWQQADRFKSTVDKQARIHGFSVLYKASFLRFYKDCRPAPSDECPELGDSVAEKKDTVPCASAQAPALPSPSIASDGIAETPALSTIVGAASTDSEAEFRARITADVQARLSKFSFSENIRIVYAPLVITDLIWYYAFSTIEKAAKYKISETKKLSCVVRMLHDKQRDLYLKDLKPAHLRNIEQQTALFRQSVTTLLLQLWFCVNNEVHRVAPELHYLDLRTDAFVAIVLLDWHREHNRRMDSIIAERMGHTANKYETPIHDALRDAMAAYVAPANPSFNIHIETAIRILENKINTTDFKPFSE